MAKEPAIFQVTVTSDRLVSWINPQRMQRKGYLGWNTVTEKTIRVFDRLLASGRIEQQDELIVLGSSLYAALFYVQDPDAHTTLDQDFRTALTKVDEDGGTLRLVLIFAEGAAKLAAYPWEYLYYPDAEGHQGYFIAAKEKGLILVRRSMNDVPLPKPQTPREALRILLVVSKPRNWGAVKEGPVVVALEKLRDMAKDDRSAPRIELATCPPTKHDLEIALKRSRPHILHFVGHGKYTEGKGGGLIFENEDGKGELVSDADLASCLRDSHEPQLVFLHACEGARTDDYESFRGVALRLLYATRIPAIVAMQYKIENDVANLFATTFYHALGQGKPLDQAVQAGRKKLGHYLDAGKAFSSRAFGSPVVFLQSLGEIILPETGDDGGESRATKKPKMTCPWGDCHETLMAGDRRCRKCHLDVEPCLTPTCDRPLRRALEACSQCLRGGLDDVALVSEQKKSAEPAAPMPGEPVGPPSTQSALVAAGRPQPQTASPQASPASAPRDI